MLDTRKISEFIDPQKLVVKLNRHSAHVFSDWGANSINLVISDVLRDHMQKVVDEGENLDKLNDAFVKIGIRKNHQLLILTSKLGFALFEPLSEKKLICGFGIIIHGMAQVVATCAMEHKGGGKDWVHFDQIAPSRAFDVMANAKDMEIVQSLVLSYASYYLFLNFVEVETLYIEPKEKFKPAKYEGFKNMQKIPIRVADLGWARETINKLPFGVTGHLRNQPVGAGRKERKLIYIEPFMKQGLVRKSGKERILKVN